MNLQNLFIKFKGKKVFFFVFVFFIISITSLFYFISINTKTEEDKEKDENLAIEESNKEIVEQLEFKKTGDEKEIKRIIPKESKSKNDSPKKTNKTENIKEKDPKEVIKDIKQKKFDQNPEDVVSFLHQGLQKISAGSFKNYEEITKLVNKTYNTEKMLKMIIGEAWKNINSNEKKELIIVFNEYISKNYIKRFSKIKDPVFETLENKKLANFFMIKTLLLLKNNEKVSISYLLTEKDEEWKIFDVLLAGSVSEIATKKSEFNSFLKDGKIDSLLEALRKKNKLLLKN